MNVVPPEVARARQTKCRNKKRSAGLELINRWTHLSIRKMVYQIIDKINEDNESGSTEFLRFVIDIINAEHGSKLRAIKINGKWHFEMFTPDS